MLPRSGRVIFHDPAIKHPPARICLRVSRFNLFISNEATIINCFSLFIFIYSFHVMSHSQNHPFARHTPIRIYVRRRRGPPARHSCTYMLRRALILMDTQEKDHFIIVWETRRIRTICFRDIHVSGRLMEVPRYMKESVCRSSWNLCDSYL